MAKKSDHLAGFEAEDTGGLFSSLLAERRFTAADFSLDAINHPDPTDNFRAALSVEQPLQYVNFRD